MNLKKILTFLPFYALTVLKERRLALIVCFSFILLVANAQIDKTSILEKLKLELLPQNQEANPFQFPREKYIIQCLETNLTVESDDCERVNASIDKFYEIDKTGGDAEKIEYIRLISRFQCPKAFQFLETQIKHNTSLAVRCDAIVCLAWSLQTDYLSCDIQTLKTFEEEFAGMGFISISRNTLINGRYINKVTTNSGKRIVTLGNIALPVARRQAGVLNKHLYFCPINN